MPADLRLGKTAEQQTPSHTADHEVTSVRATINSAVRREDAL